MLFRRNKEGIWSGRGGHCPLVGFSATFLVIKVFYYLNQVAGVLVSVLLAYTTLSLKGLKDVAMAVERALRNGDIQGAREALSHMVGRDTGSLEMPEIVRGTIESVAENTSDGVIAPALFLVVGGLRWPWHTRP